MTDTALEVERELLTRELQLREAEAHPAGLLKHMVCKDQREAVEFRFNVDQPAGLWDWEHPENRYEPWSWQRQFLDWVWENKSCISLKARQLGVTWVGCGLAVWISLYRPGSLSLMYRQKLDDAKELIERCGILIDSLPPYLLNGGKVIQRKENIEVTFPDGNVSKILSQSSSDTSGHGKTAAFALLDEYAIIDNAAAIMKAVNSAVGSTGMMLIISTADGVSNEQTGAGNHFHRLWVGGPDAGLSTMFLPYWFHPDRDDNWKQNDKEYRRLTSWQKLEQYPATPTEAFTISSEAYFDGDAMLWYGTQLAKPLYRCEFRLHRVGQARLYKHDTGWVTVYRKPQKDHQYAIGVDTSEGRGLDFSAAYVVDLTDMALCAEFHGKLDADLYAEQLHYLGKWYNTALIAIEDAGGFGSPVIIALRDGREGRPAYSRLYRHRQFARLDQLEHKTIGFPMNKTTRPAVLAHFEEAVREHSLPWLTEGLLGEMQTFIRFNKNKPDAAGPWPKAREGCNDDRVMSCAITLEMFRQRGEHPRKPKRKTRPYKPQYPWGA